MTTNQPEIMEIDSADGDAISPAKESVIGHASGKTDSQEKQTEVGDDKTDAK